MFVSMKRRGYTRDGAQYAQGYFLMLMQCKEDRDLPVRGMVRYARMSQLGHFMMANVKVAGHTLVLSGTYGSDALLMDVPREVYEQGEELPQELYQAWATGEGHNGPGHEEEAMRLWGQRLIPLRAGTRLQTKIERVQRNATLLQQAKRKAVEAMARTKGRENLIKEGLGWMLPLLSD